MIRAQFTKSFVIAALLITNVTSCMSNDERSGFSLMPTSFGQSPSALNLPSFSASDSLDNETAAAFQAIREENRRKEQDTTRRGEVLLQVLSNMDRRLDSLANTIDQRVSSRSIFLADLLGSANPLDYLVSRLTVLLERIDEGFKITPEEIQLIGQRFPNIRELDLVNTNLGDEGVRALSEQPYAQRLTTLTISGNAISEKTFPILMNRFTNLKKLNVVPKKQETGD